MFNQKLSVQVIHNFVDNLVLYLDLDVRYRLCSWIGRFAQVSPYCRMTLKFGTFVLPKCVSIVVTRSQI